MTSFTTRPSRNRSSEQAGLGAALAAARGLARRREAHVLEAGGGGDAAARGAGDEADLEEEGLDDLLEGAALLGERGGDGLDAHRAAVEALADHGQVAAVERVEARVIDREAIEGR